MRIHKFYFLFFAVFVTSFAQAQPINLNDIESVILQRQYKQVNQLYNAFIEQTTDKEEIDDAMYFLGVSYLRLGQYNEAIKAFKDLIRRSPKQDLLDKSHLGLIDAYYLSEDYKKALSAAKKLAARRANSEYLSLIYLKLARSNLKLARWKDARRYLEKIVTNFPYSLEQHTARQLLEEKHFFTVQIGSFLDRLKAEVLMEELKHKGEYAYMVQTEMRDGRIFYRVRVGQLTVLNDAKALQAKLTEWGYPTLIYP